MSSITTQWKKSRTFEGHADFIRCLEVHPTLPYIFSSSDDKMIKMWDWDQGFDCMQTFEGHMHYVMQVKFNPEDTNTFASASLDRTIKVWGLGSHVPHYTLEGHEGGVNCVDYYPSGDKPYILSGADDRTVKIWDYQVCYVMSCCVRAVSLVCGSFASTTDTIHIFLFLNDLLDQIDCSFLGRTFAQCMRSHVPPQVAHHCLGFGRRYRSHLAEYNVPC